MPFKFEVDRFFNDGVSEDFYRMVVGPRIGAGVFREVFEYKLDSNYVIKIETDDLSFANIREWEIWNSLSYSPAKVWLAPCLSISPRGQFLIQRKTEELTPADRLPTMIPSFFDDIHMGNWGKLDGKIVCHDYGQHKAIRLAAGMKKVKAKWRV